MKRYWDQFLTVARVSILMGKQEIMSTPNYNIEILGTFWLFELISAALHVEYEKNYICYIQFILDAPNLFVVSIKYKKSWFTLYSIIYGFIYFRGS